MPVMRKYQRGKMTAYIILFGIILSGIIMTSAQIKIERKKEMNKILKLFDDN